jgi:starvation-inducible DNA-binding protein
MSRTPGHYTVPGLKQDTAQRVAELLQQRLNALTDLQLTLKHVHWNVVGPNFIGVHEMIDPQVDSVREMGDQVAERIATLGYEPIGTPGAIVQRRTWDDYPLRRAGTMEHMAALDIVYDGVIADHRAAMDELEDLDLVTQDLLIEQAEDLEQFQWFVRAHLESAGGALPHAGTSGTREAARAAAEATPTWAGPTGGERESDRRESDR